MIRVETSGGGVFEVLADRARDLTPVFLEEIEPLIFRFTRREFKAQGHLGVSGLVRWAPLKRTKPGKLILVGDTSRLLQALVGIAGFRSRFTRDGMEIRFDPDYAIYHQEGTSRMPARPLDPTGNPEFIDQAAQRISDFLLGPTEPRERLAGLAAS